MGKLSIVTENSPDIRIDPVGKKISYTESGQTIIITEGDLKYRPLHCSELSSRLSSRDWNKSETLFISEVSNEDNEEELIPILNYRKYTSVPPTGEIDEIDPSDDNISLSFPLCGELDESTKELIDSKYYELGLDPSDASNTVRYMISPKSALDTSECQKSINVILGTDSYTNSLNLFDLINYSSYPGTTCRIDLSVRYSKLNSYGNSADIYNYFTNIEAFKYDEDRNLNVENIIEIIGDTEELVRIEYFNGTLRLFPVSPKVTECIINDCTVVYGKFR